jgi:ABC-type sugar transport system ATPase subunit
MAGDAAALRVRGLRKSFDGVHAVRGVDLTLRRGRIHALLGENGAGKSTLVNMMCGILRPDGGTLEIDDEPRVLDGPAHAQMYGIRTVHQELELAGTVSVAENVCMGRIPHRFGVVRARDVGATTRSALGEIGSTLDPRMRVDGLPIAEQQLVEIARGLAARPRVLFLDEPTAALSPAESDALLGRLRKLAASGVAILYISHHLDEVFAVADEVTVLRDGLVVLSAETRELDHGAVVRAMLGAELVEKAAPVPAATGEELIHVEGLGCEPVLAPASFHVDRGELVGFFGLAGSGHDVIANLLFGLRAPSSGVARFAGGRLPRTPGEAQRRGIGYVPADRKGEGLALTMSIQDNLLLGTRRIHARAGLRDAAAERRQAEGLVLRYGIKISSLDDPVSSLSGGNQQKVVLARQPAGKQLTALILCEPTRGVDVGAKAEIHDLLREFAAGGGAGVVVSSDADEVVALCDRVYVVRRGVIVRVLMNGEFDAGRLSAAAL